MVNYGEAFKRPFQDIKKLLIGVVLYILPIVNFFAVGYQLNCAKSALKKDYKLPEWQNWGDLFVKGFLSAVIGIIYFIPALIALMAAVGAAIFTYINQGTEAVMGLITGMGSGLIIFLILALLAAYLSPMAILSYVNTFKFGDAFNFRTISKKAFTGKYFVVWLLMVLYVLILGIILANIPFIGTAIAGFIVGVTAFTAYGEVFAEIK